MRFFAYFLFILLFQTNLNAQVSDRLAIELSMGRLAKNTGVVWTPEHYSLTPSFIPGVRLQYAYAKKWKSYVGFWQLNTLLRDVGGGEDLRVKGAALHIGTKFSPNAHNKVFFSYGVEVFQEFTILQGIFEEDVPPYCHEINHKKNFLGFAPNLTLNIKLNSKAILFTETRKQFGSVRITPLNSTHSDKPLYGQEHGLVTSWVAIYEPISALGLRFEL